ncbi:MAG: ABC transporter substrate-binding protein [Chloroflexota bacterium]
MDRGAQTALAQTALNVSGIILVMLGVLACARPGPPHAPPTIKIGLVAPFEGLHRPLGYEALFGVKLALQERNQGQGLRGYRVELVALNDFDDPAAARQQAQAVIVDPDILGVVGHLSSATTLAAAPIYQQADLALSIPWPVSFFPQKIEEKGRVSVAASAAETANVLARVARLRGVGAMERLTTPDVSGLPSSTQALELDTEGVLAGEILLALKAAHWSMPVYGQVDAGSPQLVQVAQAAANGLIFVSPAPAPQDVGAATFVDAYQTLAGFPPGPRAVLAYDATHVLLDAIEQAIINHDRLPSRAEVSAIIGSIKREGLSGELAFDQQGRREDAPVWVYQISNQEYPGTLIAP